MILPGRGHTHEPVAPGAILFSIFLLAAAVVSGSAVKPALAAALLVTTVASLHRRLFAWGALLNLIVVIIMFVPMRRYALPSSLPFQLELYRVVIAAVLFIWATALLADPRIRVAKSIVDVPLLSIFLVAAASIAVNYPAIAAEQATSSAIKQLTFLVSYLCFFYLLVSLVRDFETIDSLIRIVVGCGTVVAISGIVEYQTHFNVFNHIQTVVPILHQVADPGEAVRGGNLRVLASSQHPIALGAVLVMLVPFALYLANKTGQRRWIVSTALLCVTAFATGSRTAIVMLAVILIVYLCLYPRQTLRLWPLAIPLVLAIHLGAPGIMSEIYRLFFPKGGIVADQADANIGSSRIASLGPGLHLIGLNPLFGGGYGSRIFSASDPNAFIVDDQWLSNGIDTGLLGIAVWIWFFVRFLRPIFGAARRAATPYAGLFTACGASTTAFAAGMLTYDAFSFIQTTFVLFLIVGIGCVALRLSRLDPIQAKPAS